jgi:UDP-N-acetylmuramoyl-tripeptide--D-alanyl-D-alanine ligase
VTGDPAARALASPAELAAGEVAAMAGGRVMRGDPATPVRGAAIDSRTIAPGMLFVALRGERTDGHRFVDEALRRGAGAALISDLPFGGRGHPPGGGVLIQVTDTLRAFQRLARAIRDRQGPRVVGITGSVGKTSTKEMAAGIAARRYRTGRSTENWNTEIGIPLALANLPGDCEVAILELAMRGPGQIRELVEISRPQIGVITLVGESHMDFFETREQLAEAKGELLEGLPRDGAAIVNAEDPLALALLRRSPARAMTFGLRCGDVRAEEIRMDPGRGSLFSLQLPQGRAEVRLRIPGRHAITNALAAAAIGAALGIAPEEIAAGLAAAAPLPMRLEILKCGETTVLNDVYNSSPQSVEAALEVMDQITGAPRIAVLGDMKELGAVSAEAHRRVGRLAAGRRMDLVIAYGPLAGDIAAGASEAVAADPASLGDIRIVHTTDLDDAVAALREEVRPGAVVLVKGSRIMAMEKVVSALETMLRMPGRTV